MTKIKTLALLVGLAVSAPALAAGSSASLEARMAQLEQRLQQAEARAETAEKQIQQLTKQDVKREQEIASVKESTPVEVKQDGISKNKLLTLNGFDNLKLYGDVEFNVDGASRSGQLTSIRTEDNKNFRDGNNERWDVNGRLLIGLDGYRRNDNGQFSGFSVQPTANLNGSMGVDDAAFFFGEEKDWMAKIGRFEAYDMFPLNQDTFIEYSGNTANDLYADGYGYVYMMKEGRGRSDSGGNILLNKNLGNWYFELNTLMEDGTSLYADRNYHGNQLDNDKNTVYLRPIIAWKGDVFSVAAAMETNVVNNAYGYKDGDEFVDQSKRNGYGMTMTWDGQKADPENGIVANLSTAYMDASDEKDFTVGANALWKRFELGYIYAHNKIEDFNINGVRASDYDDDWFDEPGDYDIHTIHASYLIPNVMDMQNFNVYLGAYVSMLEADKTYSSDDDSDQRYGARVRFKYFF
ncbi:carbohydrate porin [Rahnella victoriana]|uniref:carbohydrate porin n=1 Tax=Rahnella victoriana TaxID=1510570 RepID=UPI001E4A8C42|nr:carbohydrate porin [Rahnella victoriana]UHM89142.1 carbohydrate porin [Rahnella victoriana]